jgi:cytoplasmic tRNA 2-thiolation protein 2
MNWKERTAIRSLATVSAEDAAGALTAENLVSGCPQDHVGAVSELCYACHTMLTSRARTRGEPNSVSTPVPHWTGTTLAERRAAMRSTVSEFILNDDDN